MRIIDRHVTEGLLSDPNQTSRVEVIPPAARCWTSPLAVLCVLALGSFARAAPTTAEQAGSVVSGWLRLEAKPMDTTVGNKAARVETFKDAEGQPTYYIVYLDPTGFVIVAADDLVEPIIGFVPAGTYNPSDENPLGALVSRDLPGRIQAARKMLAKAAQPATD